MGRASYACTACRRRKVRCDAALRTPPCTNCALDGKPCELTGRRSRLKWGQQLTAVRQALGAHNENQQQLERPRTDQDYRHSKHRETPPPSIIAENIDQTTDEEYHKHWSDMVDLPEMSSPNHSPGNNLEFAILGPTMRKKLLRDVPSTTGQPETTEIHVSSDRLLHKDQSMFNIGSSKNDGPEVTQHFSFLRLDAIFQLDSSTLAFLLSQGCLCVPPRPILDMFIYAYFRHVHVVLPILHEGDFWDMLSTRHASGRSSEKVSLLLLQSMIFASSSFVSFSSIQKLGFQSYRSARNALYRRAKLLYDLETESASIQIPQAALLLSFWNSPSKTTFNQSSLWIQTSCEHAMRLGAHRRPHSRRTDSSNEEQGSRDSTLRRLWLGCIIRDRINPLCTRRKIFITQDELNLDREHPLDGCDLESEMYGSRVYDPVTKYELYRTLDHLVRLLIIDTDILTLNAGVSTSTRGEPGLDLRVKTCAEKLEKWFHDARSQSQIFSTERDKKLTAAYSLDAVYLYTAYVRIVYQASRIMLRHSQLLSQFSQRDRLSSEEVLESIYDLEDASSSMTETVDSLAKRTLAHLLPISAIAYVATPLALYTLTSQFNPPGSGSVSDQSTMAKVDRNRVHGNILASVLATLQSYYDGTEWVNTLVRHVCHQARRLETISDQTYPLIRYWGRILEFQPTVYMRLVMIIDLGLDISKVPHEDNFPPFLRGLLQRGDLIGSVLDNPPGGIAPVSLATTKTIDGDSWDQTEDNDTGNLQMVLSKTQDLHSSFIFDCDQPLTDSWDEDLCGDIKNPENIGGQSEDTPLDYQTLGPILFNAMDNLPMGLDISISVLNE